MQVNRTGVGLIGFFALAGLGLLVLPVLFGAPAQVTAIVGSIGAIWIVVAIGLVLYSRGQDRKGAHREEIVRSGIKGRATILDVGGSAEVNGMPLVKMKLELDIPGQGTRQARCREIMPVFAARRMEKGLVLPVFANPRDPEDFVLVW